MEKLIAMLKEIEIEYGIESEDELYLIILCIKDMLDISSDSGEIFGS